MELPTCFDHNFLKSTNSTSIQVSPDSSRRDLNRGAKRFLLPVNFVGDLSRKDELRLTAAEERGPFAADGGRPED